MLARLMAFVVWGLLACSGVYWLVQLLVKPVPTQALPVSEQGAAAADLSRLFGAAAAAPARIEAPADSRFKLLGLVAPKSSAPAHAGEGVALIAVDGVARTVRVGAVLDGELRLLSVSGRSVNLGRDGQVSMSLQLALPNPASTGTLQPAAPSATILGGDMPQLAPQVMPPPAAPTPGAGLPMPGAPNTPLVDSRGLPS